MSEMLFSTGMGPRRPIARTASRRSRRAIGAIALVLATSALISGGAFAQPTRRDQPLRTPRPGAAPSASAPAGKTGPGQAAPGPQGSAAPGQPATPGAPPTGSAAPGAGGAPAEDPTAIFKKSTDIEFKPKGGPVSFNFDDVELPELVKAISQITGFKFIISGKVRQMKATVVAPGKISVGEAYAAFLSVLESNALTVIPQGRFLKIDESAGVSNKTTPVLGTATPVPDEDRFVTRMYRPAHASADEVSAVLQNFKSTAGNITVYAPTNLLILTDTGANIRRMLRIVEEIDAVGAGEQIYMQPIHYASSEELATKLNELLDLGDGKARILADERNNTLIIVATEGDYLRVLELIKAMDQPTAGEGSIHVLPLQHAKCDELSQTVSQILGGAAGAPRTTPSAPTNRTQARRQAAAASTASAQGGEDAIFEGAIKVVCDEATNSLVTTSSLRDYAQLRAVVDKLDQPRRQVFLEAVIMDVGVNHSSQLGLGYHGGGTADLGGGGDTIIYGGFNAQQSLTGLPANLEALAFGVRGPDLEGTTNLLPTGVSIPGLGLVLNALAKSGDSNVLATPHVLATDNIAAKISIGQNIALQTNVGGGLGQLASLAGGAGAGAGGLGALGALAGGLGFQAPRQDVGIQLDITPHINDSDQVRLEIIEEFSNPGDPQGDLGAVPINKRTAETTVIVRDQQTVVIGGLMQESKTHGETKIPVLGDIPVLGVLFRTTTRGTVKTNLLLIITPHIVRDQSDLRVIFERKMQERQEFLDRYFVFSDTLPWEPIQDYTRANGLVERIRQTQIELAERERLLAQIAPDGPKTHEPVKAVQLPSVAGSGGGGGKAAPKAPPPTTRTPRPVQPKEAPASGTRTGRPDFKVPGAVTPQRAPSPVE